MKCRNSPLLLKFSKEVNLEQTMYNIKVLLEIKQQELQLATNDQENSSRHLIALGRQQGTSLTLM